MLFEPFTIRGLTLKNRLVVPPMVHYRCEAGHTCGTFHVVHLGRYALGGFGLVFVEVTAVEEIGLINENDMGIWNDAQAESFKPLIAFMKRQGTRDRHPDRPWRPQVFLAERDAGHGAADRGEHQSRRQGLAAGGTDIRAGCRWLAETAGADHGRMQGDAGTWAAAARRRFAAGFDTIEVHTAHGYLLASFLSPVSNTRNDEYGGDRAGRMRLPLEIVEAVRKEMPDTMPLFVRVSSVDGTVEGWNMDDTVVFARELKARGVDVIDCSSGGISGAATAAQVTRSLGFQVPFAERSARKPTFRPWPSASSWRRSRPRPSFRTSRPI